MEHKQVLVRALRTLLRPVVRLMIAVGFNARDFIEVLKTVYVEIARDEYGKRGRKSNISKTAILTGLTRREAARLSTVSASDPLNLEDPMVPVGKVLSTWHQDPRYLDDKGRPRVLAQATEFAKLLAECRGDIPVTAIVKELELSRCIRIEGGSVSVLSRYFMPVPLESRAIERFGRVFGDFSSSIVFNVMNTENQRPRFEGRAVDASVSVASLDAFHNYLDRRGQEFLEEMDNWLGDHADSHAEVATTRVGVGVYMIGDID